MQRRDFLKTGLAAGGASLVTGCGGTSDEKAPPAAVEADAAPSDRWSVPAFEHDEATVAQLQQAQSEGRLSARALAESYLARMDAVDAAGPRLNSVIERNPDALAIADELDRERKERGARGPLHGIPVLIKDNIDTADRMRTSAGSLALASSIAPRDAAIVERLRAAGAVILGKTNLSEWANFRSTRSTSGWSGRGGLTRNPYALDRSACGSSSGSGAATAANLCAIAVGTETDGSIVCPSKANGLVGIKPTVGLVSRAGIIPISASQDTAGPMARTVADAAALLSALAGVDTRDPATQKAAGPLQADYTTFLDANALQGARLGVARGMFGNNGLVAGVIEQALADLSRLGAAIVELPDFKASSEVDDAEWLVLQYEFKDGLNAYLAALGPDAPYKTLEELIAFNEANRDRSMPWFGQEIFTMCQEKGPLTSKEYLDASATARRLSTVEGIDKVMDANRLDAIVAPTGDPAFTIDLVNGDHYTGGGTSTLPAVSGYPHITVPAGQVSGLPVGLSFFGRAFSEPRLIALAYAYEQATRHRQAPGFLRTAALTS
jgi:amidase